MVLFSSKMSTTMSPQNICFDSNKASSHRVDVRNSGLGRITHNLPSCVRTNVARHDSRLMNFPDMLTVTHQLPCTKTCRGQKYFIEIGDETFYFQEVTHFSKEDITTSSECKICFRQFSDETPDRTPRILTNCGHTVCESCMNNLLRNTEIVCPFDRTVTNVPRADVTQLKKNFTLLEVIQEQKKASATGEWNAEPKGRVQCVENVKHEAFYYCMQCDVDLCERCFTETHKHKFLANHQKVLTLEKPIKLPNCTQHPYNTAEFLCKDSNCVSTVKMMCHTCILTGEHKQHEYELLMDQLSKNEQAVKSFLGTIKERVEQEKIKNDHIKLCVKSFEPGEASSLKNMEPIGNYFGIERTKALEPKLCDKNFETARASYSNNIKRIENYFETEKKKALEQFRTFASDSKNKIEAEKQRTETNLKVFEKLRSETEQLLKKKNNLFSVNDFLERGKKCLLTGPEFVSLNKMDDYNYTLPAIGALEIKKKD